MSRTSTSKAEACPRAFDGASRCSCQNLTGSLHSTKSSGYSLMSSPGLTLAESVRAPGLQSSFVTQLRRLAFRNCEAGQAAKKKRGAKVALQFNLRPDQKLVYRPAATEGGFLRVGFHRRGGDEADAQRPFRVDLGPDKGRCLAGAVSGCWVDPVLDRADKA